MGIDFEDLNSVANGRNVDQAAEFAKSRFGEHADRIDAVADKAKHYLDGEAQGEHGGEDGTTADGESFRQQEDGHGRHFRKEPDDSAGGAGYGGEVAPARGDDERGTADECGEVSYGGGDLERGLGG
ncbi:Rv0909 family putative TA system antitoxin [Amycolatopsis sp. cmx-4-83]|uniref:Rv0909 family putative TA system antitoxin n=1 Tax=Amycolatopsis sp. cmx-4-83 TaxID=2790940 RepID=UPI00397DFE20